MERTFTEAQVRRLIWVIGFVTPMRVMGDIYDNLEEFIVEGKFPEVRDLMMIARGTWHNAGSYALAGPETNMDKGGQ